MGHCLAGVQNLEFGWAADTLEPLNQSLPLQSTIYNKIKIYICTYKYLYIVFLYSNSRREGDNVASGKLSPQYISHMVSDNYNSDYVLESVLVMEHIYINK